jgi:hypothetical protein
MALKTCFPLPFFIIKSAKYLKFLLPTLERNDSRHFMNLFRDYELPYWIKIVVSPDKSMPTDNWYIFQMKILDYLPLINSLHYVTFKDKDCDEILLTTNRF